MDFVGGTTERVSVAIEVPRGAIVEGLVERGFHVFAINPKQLDRFRDRHSVAGAKDDRRDAFVLADALRTDQPSFRRLRLDEPQLLLLRELSRAEEMLLEEFRRSANRLRDQLHRLYPQMLQLCAAADEPWLWDLLDSSAPRPGRLAERGAGAPGTQDVSHSAREGPRGADVLTGPSPARCPWCHRSRSDPLSVLTARLRVLAEHLLACSQQVSALLHTLAEEPGDGEGSSDVAIVQSLPGSVARSRPGCLPKPPSLGPTGLASVAHA